MKTVILIVILFLVTISCSENSTSPIDNNNVFNLSDEAANFPWELVSGKIVYYRSTPGIIFIDSEKREMTLLKDKAITCLSWHPSGTKVTGFQQGGIDPIHGGSPGYFICIDLKGNNTSVQHTPHGIHSWSNSYSVAAAEGIVYGQINININGGRFLSSLDNNSILSTRPAWSADSKYLIVSILANDRGQTYSQLHKYDVLTKIGKTLIRADSTGWRFFFEDPIYSPDGNKISYISGTGYENIYSKAVREIWVMDSDGSNKKQITSGYSDSYPAWSPDGSKILFTRRTIENSNSRELTEGIYMVNVDGTGLRKILSEGSDLPIWK